MTYSDLQLAVLGDRFTQADLPDVQAWINYRYAELWALEEWTFKQRAADVSVTAGASTVTPPNDFGTALALRRANGQQLRYLDPVSFDDLYYDTTSSYTGTPEAYTITSVPVLPLGGFPFGGGHPNDAGIGIAVGPVPNETATYRLSYEAELTALSNGRDVPNIPSAFQHILVPGAQSYGLRLRHDPTWTALEQSYQQGVQAMRENYLVTQRGAPMQFGAYRPY